MGNRAVIHFDNDGEKHGIYLHWNGGRESVLAFLAVMKNRGWTRMDYASARFTAVVVEFFDAQGDDMSGLSVGVLDDPTRWVQGCDNGGYEVFKSKDGGFSVKQNGKPISYSKLSKGDKEAHDGIVDVLSVLRDLRKSAAQKAGSK